MVASTKKKAAKKKVAKEIPIPAIPPLSLATLSEEVLKIKEAIAQSDKLLLNLHSKLTWSMNILKVQREVSEGHSEELTFLAEYDRQLAAHLAEVEAKTVPEKVVN